MVQILEIENKMKERGERKIMHYSSKHKILLVGEGDFSFSKCLANAFGTAVNITATSLDSEASLRIKYTDAMENMRKLKELGCTILHEVDAITMKNHPLLNLKLFDRIVFNFPHAGFIYKEHSPIMIESHRRLLDGFFKNASGMLRPYGEVHVNHKTAAPYSKWNLEELANRNSLGLIERVSFNQKDYPGYKNKRGSGARCDDKFHLGECCTFKFNLDPTLKVSGPVKKFNRPLEHPKAPAFMLQQQPSYFEFRDPPMNFIKFTTDSPRFNMSYIQQGRTVVWAGVGLSPGPFVFLTRYY